MSTTLTSNDADGLNSYNGWSNYATWRINLEIIDDYAASLVGEQTFPDVNALAEAMAETVDDVLTEWGATPTSLLLDYARAFVSNVNFHEIAEAHADDLVQADDIDDVLADATWDLQHGAA